MFTCIFSLARASGRNKQWQEMIADPEYKIGRPRKLYKGPQRREVVPLARRSRRRRSLLRALRKGFHDRRVRHVARALARGRGDQLQTLEIFAPLRGHRLRIPQPVLVQLLDERRVAAEKMGVLQELLHHGLRFRKPRMTARRLRITLR